MSISGSKVYSPVMQRQNLGGVNVGVGQGKVELLNSKGIDAQGNKVLTAGERYTKMADGANKAQFKPGDAAHLNTAAAANANAKATYANAAANGNITKYESTQIKQADRKANVANKQVGVDTERRTYGAMEKKFAADGKITPYENARLTQEKGKLNAMGKELNNLKAQDTRLTAKENKTLNNPFAKIGSAVQDAFHIGKPVGSPIQPMRLPPTHVPTPRPPIGPAHIAPPPGGTGRLAPHVAVDQGRLRFTDSQGINKATGNKYLYQGEKLGMMRDGANKAQFKPSDAAHQFQAADANNRLNQTYANARADGYTSLFERKDIAGAKRDVNIADKQVAYDTERRQFGTMEKNFARDGKLTVGERNALASERTKMGAMGTELNNLRNQDRAADAGDAAFKANPFNQFRNAVGEITHGAGQFLNTFQPMQPPMLPPAVSFGGSVTFASYSSVASLNVSSSFSSSIRF